MALKASGFPLREVGAASGFEQKTGSLTCVFNLFSAVTGLRKNVCEPGQISEGHWRVVTHLHVLHVPWPFPPGTLSGPVCGIWESMPSSPLNWLCLKLAPAPLESYFCSRSLRSTFGS